MPLPKGTLGSPVSPTTEEGKKQSLIPPMGVLRGLFRFFGFEEDVNDLVYEVLIFGGKFLKKADELCKLFVGVMDEHFPFPGGEPLFINPEL
jgi:hypothetical protein